MPHEFSAEETVELVEKHLPGFVRACHVASADQIILHQGAFGCSTSELMLFALLLKYAGIQGKNIIVVK